MATREDVLIRFGGDSKGVNATLAGIRSSVASLASFIPGALAGLGVGSLASAFKDTLSWADDLVETADRVGLTTEAVQALRLEAELFGVTTEEVDLALTKFSINLGKARKGSGDLLKVMQQYGKVVAGDDVEAIKQYIGLLQNASNAAEQNRIAVAGFGKAGANMAQAIAESNIPLDEMVQKFQKLGMVMEDDGARKLAELNDQFDRLAQMGSARLKKFVVDAMREIETLGSGFNRLGQLLSHWASGDFIGMDQIIKWEKQATKSVEEVRKAATWTADPAGVGDSTEDFQKFLADRRTALATSTELEAEILKQYAAEANAIRKGEEEAAAAAQKAQEDAFRALAGKDVSSSLLASYERLVGEMKSKPVTVAADIKVSPESWANMTLGMREALTAGGASIVQVPIKPFIVWGDSTDPGATSPTMNPGDYLTRDVDQVGAAP